VTSVISRGRRLAVANSRWQVYFDHLADGQSNEVPNYLVLDRPRPRTDRVAGIAVLPVLGDKLLLIRAYRHPLGRELWEAPRGFIDGEETAAAAALRELTEETSLRCAPADLIALGHYAPEPGTMAARGALFVATRCEGTPRRPEDELGLGALAMMDHQQTADLIATGEIEDAGTLILYYRYCELLRL
jgi:8-oxo-dGTP pyrophosphatase MutT (NUDIX family)